MDYCVQLSFENVNSPELGAFGVDHVKVAEGMGCKAIGVTEPETILPALEKAKTLTEDDRDKGKEKVQDVLKSYEAKIDDVADKKAKEVMEQ